MTILKAGQKLWWIDRKRQIEGYVIVAEITESMISVWHDGKKVDKPISIIGKTLFLEPQLSKRIVSSSSSKVEYAKKSVSKESYKLKDVPVYRKNNSPPPSKAIVCDNKEKIEQRFYDPIQSSEKSCDKCALRKNGTCGSLQGVLCEDYRSIQIVSAEERNAYPQYGDATALRKKDRKHFK